MLLHDHDITMTRYNDYDPFAKIYHRHWENFAEMVFPILEDIALTHLPPHARVLDLCCGTGKLAELLTKQGFRVTGVDGSKEMVRIAEHRVPESRFVIADAREFDVGTGFHAVFSTFDSLNHILDLEELSQAFSHVYRSLSPGGMFVFDLNTRVGFQERWKGSFNIVEDDHAIIIQNEYDAKENLATFLATLFVKHDIEETWSRTDLELTQTSYPDEDIIKILKNTGFSMVTSLQPIDSGRTFFKALK